MVFQLDDDLWFPKPQLGNPNGLIAVGGDLSFDRLMLAYSNGYFPWYDYRNAKQIQWYCPLQRFVIFPAEIHISHSMRSLLNKERYSVTMNQAFEQVIAQCGALRDHLEGAWLGPEMKAAYTELHELQFASSVEVWEGDKLVGGLYGVDLGNCFFGESMFSLVPSASKIALIGLAQHMQANGGVLIDCQFETPHLKSMGGRYIPYDEYIRLINS